MAAANDLGLVRRPTMRDVAKAAGVGLATVSRVVNGAEAVSEETANQVRRAIAELGFQRDEIARTLRPGQHSWTIGMLIGDLTNPFWSQLANGALSEAKQAGYAVLVGTADEDPAAERRAVEALTSRRVSGLIIVPGGEDHRFLLGPNNRPRVPVVFVDRPARGVEADVVAFDNHRGGRLATQHLIEHGHRRIAVLVAPSYYTTGLRLRGYRQAMREAGLDIDDSLIIQLRHGSAVEASEATRRLLHMASPPTAIFSTTDFLTEGVITALGKRHRSVAVVGFDDLPLASLLATPVTVVTADVHEVGRRAAQLLLDRIGAQDRPPQHVSMPVKVIERGTGEIARTGRGPSTTPPGTTPAAESAVRGDPVALAVRAPLS